MPVPIRLKNFPPLTPVVATTSIYGYNAANDNDVQFSVTTLATYLSTLYASSTHSHGNDSGSASGFMSSADFTKLAGIASGATANSADAALLNRTNHTGTQEASTISDFAAAVRAQIEAALLPGSNVSITPGSTGATRTLTVASTGGGEGGEGGGGGAIRASDTETINLAVSASGDATLTLGKTCIIQSVTLSQAATVVIYDSVAARTADSGRILSTPPSNESGVIAQVTTSGAATFTRSVAPSNAESPGTAVYPIKVKNNGAAGDITVTVGYLNLEA